MAKKPTSKKKIVKKKPVAKKPTSMALATVSYQDIVRSEVFESKKDGKAMHLLASHFPQKVLDFINSPTPKQFILKRKGAGDKMFDYIPGWYARKCANYAFGFNYSVEIKSREIAGLTAIAEIRMIVNDPKTGKEIMHKDDIGGHEIRFLTNGKKGDPMSAVNLANDYKSAVTDGMKRCMAQMGFWKDVYGVNEAKEEGVYANGAPQEPVKAPVVEARARVVNSNVPIIEAECESCGNSLTKAEAEFSKKVFKKKLCRSCQKERK